MYLNNCIPNIFFIFQRRQVTKRMPIPLTVELKKIKAYGRYRKIPSPPDESRNKVMISVYK